MMLRKIQDALQISPMHPISTGLCPMGAINKPIDALLFDVYGTLFISASGDIGLARNRSRKSTRLQKLLKKYQIDHSPDTVLAAFFNTIGNTHQKLKAKGNDYPEVEINRIWMEVFGCKDPDRIRHFAVEFEFLFNPVFPMPHLKEVLTACREKQLPMGIISNAQFFTPLLFNLFLGADPDVLGFDSDLVIFSYQLGYAKPSPFLYDLAARQLRQKGIDPKQTLYVGNDMLNDIYPATHVGFQTGLFAGDARSLRLRKEDPRCAAITADLILTDLIQILDHL